METPKLMAQIAELRAAGVTICGWVDRTTSPADKGQRPSEVDAALRLFRKPR